MTRPKRLNLVPATQRTPDGLQTRWKPQTRAAQPGARPFVVPKVDPPRSSWWLGLDRQAFDRQAQQETARMRGSKEANLLSSISGGVIDRTRTDRTRTG